jgi:hypothetical protein
MSLATDSWETIAFVSQSGDAPHVYNIGDEKDITLTTCETLTLQIYDFDHDDLFTGNKAGITFGCKNSMATTRHMEATNTNTNSFYGSKMFGWLRDTLFPTLPADLRPIIRTVKKTTSNGNNTTTLRTDAMKLFLFSEKEVYGRCAYSVEGEGTPYPIFTDNASRIKKLSNGSGAADYWWTRSPYRRNVTDFCFFSNAGTPGTYRPILATGVCFGFCV